MKGAFITASLVTFLAVLESCSNYKIGSPEKGSWSHDTQQKLPVLEAQN